MKTRRTVQCHQCKKEIEREPNQIVRARFIFCSAACKCANRDFNAFAGLRKGDAMRGRGSRRSYIKRRGRHEHRIVAEAMLGRPLVRGEIVHHIDGNRQNNTPANLQVMSQSQHMKLHLPEMLAVRKRKSGY